MKITIKEIKVKNVITKSNLPVCDYSANPYIGCSHGCKYCYACFMKKFTFHNEKWGTFLDVKFWPPLTSLDKYSSKEIFVGSVTDPYNNLEEKYMRTRHLLEELSATNVKISLSTKSDLVLRDLDLLKKFNSPRVSFSINTLDEKFRCDMDSAKSIEARIKAMKILHNEGILTTCFISPIFPGITDIFAIIEKVKDCCDYIWLENLNLRPPFSQEILSYIDEKYPSLIPLYKKIYIDKDKSYWKELSVKVEEFALTNGFEYLVNDDTMDRVKHTPPIIVNYFYHEEIKKSSMKKI